MSERFPVCTAKEVVRVLRKVIVPMHGNKPIPIGTLKSIVEGAGLTGEDFR